MYRQPSAYAASLKGLVPVFLREIPPDDSGSDAPGEGDNASSSAAPDDIALTTTDPEAVILCRRCGHLITRLQEKTTIGGGFQHTFANPTGRVYDIGCFRNAEGCGPSGPLTNEFTWFHGYQWRIALCRACYVHLGWQFLSNSGGGGFWGLILKRLSFPI